MLGIETAAEHAESQFIERSKVRKSDHTFLPEGIQIEEAS